MSGSRSLGAKILSPLGRAVRVAVVVVNSVWLAILFFGIVYVREGDAGEKLFFAGILVYLLWESYVAVARNVRPAVKKTVRAAVAAAGGLLLLGWILAVGVGGFEYSAVRLLLVVSCIPFFSNVYIAVVQIMARPLWRIVRIVSVALNIFSAAFLTNFVVRMVSIPENEPLVYPIILVPVAYFLLNISISIMKTVSFHSEN